MSTWQKIVWVKVESEKDHEPENSGKETLCVCVSECSPLSDTPIYPVQCLTGWCLTVCGHGWLGSSTDPFSTPDQSWHILIYARHIQHEHLPTKKNHKKKQQKKGCV